MRSRAAGRALLGATTLLLLGACRRPHSRVEAISPELLDVEAEATGQPAVADGPLHDSGEASYVYRRSRAHERARLTRASDALTRLGVIDAQIGEETAVGL